MLELISTKALLSRSKYGGAWLDTGLWWQRPEEVALKALCEDEAELERCADALGRSPTAIAHRARDTGLILPREWRDAIIKKRPPKPPRELPLQYPYIVKVRGEHADLLAVNALVTRGLPDHVRADVCQEMMLALWQKQTTIEELQSDPALVRKFITGFRKANLEGGGYALSLDVPMRDGRSWYDVLPDNSSDENYDDDDEWASLTEGE
jgi:hypothetical protein